MIEWLRKRPLSLRVLIQADRMAPVTTPLNPIVAQEDGAGSATTTIKDVTLDELLGGDQKRFILVHAKTKEGQGVPPASPASISLRDPVTVPLRRCLRAAGFRL